MKKNIILLFICALIIGCTERGSDGQIVLEPNEGKHTLTGQPFRLEIDSCEYVFWHNRMSHKGNCKYCEARLRETIKQVLRDETNR